MSKSITLPNLCPHVRIQVENKAYRVFSIRYTHPKDSKEDNCVTIRDRDTMKQERIPMNEAVKIVIDK